MSTDAIPYLLLAGAIACRLTGWAFAARHFTYIQLIVCAYAGAIACRLTGWAGCCCKRTLTSKNAHYQNNGSNGYFKFFKRIPCYFHLSSFLLVVVSKYCNYSHVILSVARDLMNLSPVFNMEIPRYAQDDVFSMSLMFIMDNHQIVVLLNVKLMSLRHVFKRAKKYIRLKNPSASLSRDAKRAESSAIA